MEAATATDAMTVVERFQLKAFVEAVMVVDEGVAGTKDVDLGMMMGAGILPGPLARADEAGLDAMIERLELAEREWGDGFAPPPLLRRLVNQGRLGKKTGQGIYTWVDGKAQKGAPDAYGPELVEQLIRPYLTEAQRVLDEGIVAEADLVDAGLIFGTGFAPFRGGPLHYVAHGKAAGG